MVIAWMLVAAFGAAPAEDSLTMLKRAAKAYEELDYDLVVKLAAEVERRDDLPTTELRVEALRLLGCARVVVDPREAPPAFWRLLGRKPDFVLPPKTPPKIKDAFDKVVREVRAFREENARLARQQKIERLKLLEPVPSTARGGRPLQIALRFRDPLREIAAVHLYYRRASESAYSALALHYSEDKWRGALAGELTVSSEGFSLYYYIKTSDEQGPLLQVATPQSPAVIAVSAGTVPMKKLPRWPVFTGLGLTAASGAATLGLWLGLKNETDQWYARNGPQPGADLVLAKARGDQLAQATTVALVATCVVAAATLLLALFTEWVPD